MELYPIYKFAPNHYDPNRSGSKAPVVDYISKALVRWSSLIDICLHTKVESCPNNSANHLDSQKIDKIRRENPKDGDKGNKVRNNVQNLQAADSVNISAPD